MSRHFYLMNMDHRSHHASVHKYRKKGRVIHQVECFVWKYLMVVLCGWRKQRMEKVHVSHTHGLCLGLKNA